MLPSALPEAILQKGQISFNSFFNSQLAFSLDKLIVYGEPTLKFSKTLKNKMCFLLSGAEVAQIGRALDSTKNVVEGEAEDRVVAGSSPALGTITLSFGKEPVLRKFELGLLFCGSKYSRMLIKACSAILLRFNL
jgi:hypothetical protein